MDRLEFFQSLSLPQRERLRRHVCGMCENELSKTLRWGCSAYYTDTVCEHSDIIDRATRCLNASKHKRLHYSEPPQ